MLDGFSIKQKLAGIALLAMFGMLGVIGLQQHSLGSLNPLHEAQLLDSQLETEILMLRRHEKDFLARDDLKYFDQFNASLAQATAIADRLTLLLTTQSMDSTELAKITEILHQYGSQFSAIVQLQQKIGLDPKSGLYGSLRDSVHQAEAKIDSLQDYELRSDMLMLRRHEKDFMLRSDLGYVDKFSKQFEMFSSHLAGRTLADEAKKEIATLMQAYQQQFGAFVDGVKTQGLDPKSGLLGALRETVHQSEALFTSMNKKLVAAIAERETNLKTTNWLLALGFFVAIITSVIVVASSIVRPIRQLAGVMHDVARTRNLETRSNIQSADEVGQMSAAFNDMLAVFERSVSDVFRSTVMLGSSSEELNMITQSTRDGVLRQQIETDQVATAINEMAGTVHEVERSAREAATASLAADEHSQSGRKLVANTIDKIKLLASEVERNSIEISELKNETDNITTVLQVIGSIADQTNLLALNAAIEAARAGEQGRGFAVVADEVRTLASRSQESTREIGTIIERLQGRTGTVVTAMEQSRNQAQNCVEQADIAANALEKITTAVSSINSMNLAIATAAEEQSTVAENISRSVVKINEVATSATTAADQTLQTSASLAKLASELKSVVEQFTFRQQK